MSNDNTEKSYRLVSNIDPYLVGFSKDNKYHYLIVGYGGTHEAALADARKEIANAIESHVMAMYESQTVYDGEQLQELVESRIKVESNTVLHTSPQILKEEVIDGQYRLEVFYDSTPKVIRLQNLSVGECAHNQPHYFEQFESALNLGQGKCLPPFTLDAETGYFQLLFKRGRVIVDNEIIGSLFHPYQQSPKLEVSVTPNRVRDGEVYAVNVDIDQPGYLSLIHLGQNAQSAILIDNKKIDDLGAVRVTFPDPKSEMEMVSELSAETVQQRDLTLALLCDNKIDVTSFSTVSSTDSQNYSTVAPDLLFRQDGCVIASDILVTTK